MTASALPADLIKLAISGVVPDASEDMLSGAALLDMVETPESIDDVLGGAVACSARAAAEDPAIVGIIGLEKELAGPLWLTMESDALRLLSFGCWGDEKPGLLFFGSGGSGVDVPEESLSLS